jgi:cytochrome c peroxidase
MTNHEGQRMQRDRGVQAVARLSDGDRHALPSTPGPELEGAFRTPTLRCAAAHPSFMHTGQLAQLSQVVDFFDRGGDHAGDFPGSNELQPIGLSVRERADLTAFLGALQGPGPDAALLTAPSTP